MRIIGSPLFISDGPSGVNTSYATDRNDSADGRRDALCEIGRHAGYWSSGCFGVGLDGLWQKMLVEIRPSKSVLSLLLDAGRIVRAF